MINTLGDRLVFLACTYCGVSMPEMTPRAFSFNSPPGACAGPRAWARSTTSIQYVSCRTSPCPCYGAWCPWAKRRPQTRTVKRCVVESHLRHRPHVAISSGLPEESFWRPDLLQAPWERTLKARRCAEVGQASRRTRSAPASGLIPNLRRRVRERTAGWSRRSLGPYRSLRTARPATVSG